MVLKQDTEEKGIIEGQLVTHSVIDSYGDYFDKTALDKVDKDKTYFLSVCTFPYSLCFRNPPTDIS